MEDQDVGAVLSARESQDVLERVLLPAAAPWREIVTARRDLLRTRR